MTRLAPRIKRNKDGTVTVTGIPYNDFRMLMTEASLELYEAEKRYKSSDPEDKFWMKRLRAIIKMLEPGPWRHGVEDKPVIDLKKHERPLRWDDVKSKRHGRIVIEKIMADIEAGTFDKKADS